MDSPVTYALNDGVAAITMDDGRLNVMSMAMLAALHAALDRAAADRAIVVLRSGREGVFSAGFDLKLLAANDPQRSLAMVRSGAELALKVLSFENPVISVCGGHAFPMGAFLMLASDLRLGVAGPYRIGMNEVAIGIAVPRFGLELARQRLAPAYLNRTAVTGEMFLLEEAVAAGFLDRLATPEAAPAMLAATLDAIQRIDRPSHTTTKARLRANAIAAVRAAIDEEQTLELYQRAAARGSSVRLPGGG